MQIALNRNSLYTNQGNSSILRFIDASDRLILDVGCGAGDTGKLIKLHYPDTQVTGITCSQAEYEQAAKNLDSCICIDIEREDLAFVPDTKFDVIVFCHVLEHLVNPVATIQKVLPFLKTGGRVIIALPNIANWRERWKMAVGRFEYTDSGVMDKTHLHFYTFYTATQYLIEPIPQLKLETNLVNGSVPLGFLRHYFLSQGICKNLDELGCRWMPNLFGGEILITSIYN